MVTIFHCGTFGVNFGNSGLDNANWDKISHSITKKSHKWEESGRRPKNFLLAFIDELWKTKKIRLLKIWKNLLVISFYAYLPETTIIWGTAPEIRSETEFFVTIICCMLTEIWSARTDIFSRHFCCFTPLFTPKN